MEFPYFNIDVKEVSNQGLEKFNTFCETFGSSNLVKSYTCFSKAHKFQFTKATETGINEAHLLVFTYMKTQATCLKSKKFLPRDYQSFNEKTFLLKLESENLTRNSISSN